MQRILIIKTGYSETFRPDLTYASVSYGDILRTTPILHLFKGDEVHWLTDIKAVPLLYGLKEISSIHLVNTLDVLGLETYSWDMIINLESSRGACRLAESISGLQSEYNTSIVCNTKHIGHFLDERKQKICTGSFSGVNWSEKLFSLFGKKWKGESYFIPHKKVKVKKGLVFLNRSVGPKLPEKKWDGWDGLEQLLQAEGFSTASQKSSVLEDFISEIQLSEFVISTDSLGLHIALALNKPVLGIFGPTKAIEVAGLEHFIQKNLSSVTSRYVLKKFKKIFLGRMHTK
jgi:heptosyltransferase-2